jgi:hypothetical protein
MNRSIQVAAAITTGLYSTYYTMSYIKEDCERQQIKHQKQQQQKLQQIMAKNHEILISVVKNAEKLNVK